MAYVRVRTVDGDRHAYLVETFWDAEAGHRRQRVIEHLGLLEEVTLERVPEPYRGSPAVMSWFNAHRPALLTAAPVLQAVRDQLREAALIGDYAEIFSLTRQALDRYGSDAFIEHIVTPVLHRLGQEWYEGTVSVVDEHLITRGFAEAVREARYYGALTTGGRTPESVVLLCNPPQERHCLGLEVLEMKLMEAGYRAMTIVGGAPTPSLEERVRELAPRAVFVSTSVTTHVPETLTLARSLAEVAPEVPVVLGGQAWTEPPDGLPPSVRVLVGATSSDAVLALEDVTMEVTTPGRS